MASHNVHANPKGVFFQLGLAREPGLLLAGPSNAGLCDPGQGAALSLMQITTTFAARHPTLDTNVDIRMISALAQEIGDAFGDAHERLTRDEAARQATERPQ
jgi:hypothetical protein